VRGFDAFNNSAILGLEATSVAAALDEIGQHRCKNRHVKSRVGLTTEATSRISKLAEDGQPVRRSAALLSAEMTFEK
jgi:hypothetical protein